MSLIKRSLALLLAVVFVFALAACNKEDNPKGTTTSSDVTTAVGSNTSDGATTVTGGTSDGKQNSTKVTTTSKITEPTNDPTGSTIADLIPRTTNIKGNASKAFVSKLKGTKLSILNPWEVLPANTPLGATAAYVRQQVEKEYGVKITEGGFFSQYNEKLAADLTARKCQNDIYMVQDTYFCDWFKNGYLADLTNAMEDSGVNFSDPWYVQSAQAYLNIDFKQYGWISYDAEYVFPFSIVYNRKLMASKKLTEPSVLAKNGQWTWDKLEQYARRLTSGNNIIGFGVSNPVVMLANIVEQKGSSLVNVSRGTEPKTNITNQTVKNALSTMADWCGSKGFANTFKGRDWTAAKTDFVNGKVAMIYGFHDTIQTIKHQKKNPKDFAIVQFPAEKGSKSYKNVGIPQFVNFIPAQHRERAAQILFLRNEMYRHSYRFYARDFTIRWKDYFSDPGVLDNACNLKYARKGNETVFDWVNITESGTTTTKTVLNYVIDNDGNVETAINKHKSAIEKNYSKTWKGHKITGRIS